jgi:hypothetical protein
MTRTVSKAHISMSDYLQSVADDDGDEEGFFFD